MHVEVMSPLMDEAVKHIVQHDRMSDSCEPGQWVYGSSASNISEPCVAEPRDFSHREYQMHDNHQNCNWDEERKKHSVVWKDEVIKNAKPIVNESQKRKLTA